MTGPAYVYASENGNKEREHVAVCPDHAGRILTYGKSWRNATVVAGAHNAIFHREGR